MENTRIISQQQLAADYENDKTLRQQGHQHLTGDRGDRQQHAHGEDKLNQP